MVIGGLWRWQCSVAVGCGWSRALDGLVLNQPSDATAPITTANPLPADTGSSQRPSVAPGEPTASPATEAALAPQFRLPDSMLSPAEPALRPTSHPAPPTEMDRRCPKSTSDHDWRTSPPNERHINRPTESCREVIFQEINSQREDLAWLARRKGTCRQDPIVDVYDSRYAESLRELFRKLADHYSGGESSEPGLLVEAVVELLNHVRNNLFHGVKDPDDVDDRDLLGRLKPILCAVLRGSGC